jgi:arylsulfatase A-like enzyme
VRKLLLFGWGALVIPGALVCDSLGQEAPKTPSLNPDRHIVIVVWDGMRPDLVTPQNTPTLWKLAQAGVTFRDHHAVYLSATHVNAAAIETGMYPQHTGLIANYDYRPDLDDEKFVSTEVPRFIDKGDRISHGKYLQAPTLAEMVRSAGGRTAVAAAKTIGILLDRQADVQAAGSSVTLSAGQTRPASALEAMKAAAGWYPGSPIYTHAQRDAWTTAALTQSLWKDGVPAFSILWLGEPDLTQHETAPGAPAALAAIKSSDQNLATVLGALQKKGLTDQTDVFVVSDHGFSTIEQGNDVKRYLMEDGFNALVDWEEKPKSGDVILVGNGGSVLFYVVDHDAATVKRLVERLQRSNFAGVILTANPMPGTFPLNKLLIDTPNGPDVVMAGRWTKKKNQYGVPGLIESDWNRGAGKGTHATLSPFDMHNILFAAGPDFQKGAVDNLPTGNIDLAPTILRILKIPAAQPMDGRVLTEAMTGQGEDQPKAAEEKIEATQEFTDGTWRQYLSQARVGTTIYLSEGNGGFTAKAEH